MANHSQLLEAVTWCGIREPRERFRESAHREREHTTYRSCGGLGALLLVASANWKPSVSTAQTSERRERALKAKAKLLTLPLRFVCSHTNTRTHTLTNIHTYSQYINEFLTRRDFYFWILADNNNNNKYNYKRATTTTSEKSAAKQLEFWKSAQWVLVNVKAFCVCVSASTCLCVSACICMAVCVSMTSLAYLLNWQTSLENKHTHKLSTEYWALILPYYLYYLVLETSFSVSLTHSLYLCSSSIVVRKEKFNWCSIYDRNIVRTAHTQYPHLLHPLFPTPSASLVSVFLYALLLGWIICTQRTRFCFFFKSAKKKKIQQKFFKLKAKKSVAVNYL